MGPTSDPEAVVDEGGRVHGVEELFVVDASVMSEPPSANTHIPTVMVAKRLAEAIAGRLLPLILDARRQPHRRRGGR